MKPLQPENNAVPPELDEIDEDMRELSEGPPTTAPGSPPAAPPTSELLYKGAAASRARWNARRGYPELYKRAEDKVIGEVKCQPSSMKVSAIGEGSDKLKIAPWQLNGQEAFDSLDKYKRSK